MISSVFAILGPSPCFEFNSSLHHPWRKPKRATPRASQRALRSGPGRARESNRRDTRRATRSGSRLISLAGSRNPNAASALRPARFRKDAVEVPDQFSEESADEKVGMEAASGLEPEIEVLQTSALTTWLRRPERSTIEERRRSIKIRREATRPGASCVAAAQPE